MLGVWGGFKRKIATTLTGLIGVGVGLLLISFASSKSFAMVAAGAAIAGMMCVFSNTPVIALLQCLVAADKQGHVFTLLTSLSTLAEPLGLVDRRPVG